MEIKALMVPTDFSPCAEEACHAAIDIAQKAGASIYFLHLHDIRMKIAHVPALTNDSSEQNGKIEIIKDQLQLLVQEAGEHDVKAFPVLATDPGDSIENYLESLHIDVVVMGSHGTKGIREKILGSNTQHFIRHSSVPVLVVKQKTKIDFTKVVFAYNFDKDLIKPFEAVLAFVRLWRSELHLLYVNLPHHYVEPKQIMFNIKRFMHQFYKINFTPHIYNAPDEARGIQLLCSEQHVGLIALIAHKRTGVGRILSHSVVENVINCTDTPVLVMNMAYH